MVEINVEEINVIFLCLAVLSSSMVAVVMRMGTRKVQHNIGMLTVNYIVCTLLAAFYGNLQTTFDPGNPLVIRTLVLGMVNGGFYLAGFLLMQTNINKNGVVLSSIFQKLGLLVTLVLSVVVYREIPNVLQSCGFVIAIAAIILMNYQKGSGSVGSRTMLIVMLLVNGMAEGMSKVFKEAVTDPTLDGQFLLLTFATALVLCVILMKVKGQKVGLAEAAFGALIGIPNFFCTKFLLGALESLSSVIVYPVFSVGTILVVTMTGVLAFRERLNRRQWTAVAAILAALVLLNI